jgi:membrane protease YdiL (CAAX protease family)
MVAMKLLNQFAEERTYSMDILALIIAVILIIYLMQVGFPRSARQRSASRTFLRFYLHRILASWVLLSIACIIILHDGIPLSSIGLRLPNPWWPTLLACIGVGILFSLLLVMHLRTMNDELLAATEEKRRLALPRTSSERLGWVGVSINAGIWEEIVFRGFLPWYIVHHLTFFGFSVPFVWAVIFSLILFSLAHLYQGWGGVLGVGFVGITLTLFYTLTGNLLASILWHILFDVRFSFKAPTVEDTTQKPTHATEVSPNLVDGGKIGSGQDKWHSQQKDRKEQPHGQEGEKPTQSEVLKVAPESKEAANTDVPPIVPERPVRGRAAREQLLRDMGG